MDTASIIKRAMREVGDSGRNCVWEVTLPVSTESGTWALGFGGQTTIQIPALCHAATVQTALALLSSIGPGNVQVTGVPRGPFKVALIGELGGMALNELAYPLTADGSQLFELAQLTPVQIEPGDSPVLTGVATELLTYLPNVTNAEFLVQQLKVWLCETLLGHTHVNVDVETAQRIEKLSQQFDNLLDIRDRAMAEVIRIRSTASNSAGGATVGKIRKTTFNNEPYGVLSRRRGYR